MGQPSGHPVGSVGVGVGEGGGGGTLGVGVGDARESFVRGKEDGVNVGKGVYVG